VNAGASSFFHGLFVDQSGPASLECVSGGMVELPVGASMPIGSVSQAEKRGFSKSPRDFCHIAV
jgi:hypothetical protein